MRPFWLASLAVSVVFPTTVATAQQQLASMAPASYSTVSQQSSRRSVLDTRVTIALSNVSLKAALDELVQKSGVPLIYGSTVVPLNKRVSVRADALPLGDILRALLQGTSAAARLADEGRVVIERNTAVVQGTITGKVIHAKTKLPVTGATITVDDDTKGVPVGSDGAFRLSITPGEHTIHVRALGFTRVSKRVTVAEEGTVTVEVALEPSASVLNEVIVTGTVVATERRAIPNPITVITAEEIERRGITNVEQLLRGEVPGVVALERGTTSYNAGRNGYTKDGYEQTGSMVTSSVYTRGASTFRTTSTTSTAVDAEAPLKTYVDGVELVDASYLGTIDPQSIERIEIITGPQAATVYGSGAIGGVMQIFTKKGHTGGSPNLTLRLRYGMLQNSVSTGLTPSHNHTLGMTGGAGTEFSYALNTSYLYTGQWQPKMFNRTMSATVGVNYLAGPVSVSGSLSTSSGKNGAAPQYPNTYLEKFNNGSWRTYYGSPLTLDQRISLASSQTASFNVDHRMTSALQQHLTVGKSQNKFRNIPNYPQYTDAADSLYTLTSQAGDRTSLSYNATFAISPISYLSSSLTVGANGTYANSVRFGGCSISQTATAYLDCGSTVSRIVSVIESKEVSQGGFASWRLGLFDRLYVTLGLRAEKNQSYGREYKVDWTPTNGVTYVFEKDNLTIKLLGSYGRATRAPQPQFKEEVIRNEQYYLPSQYVEQVRNDSLRPERSRGPQGGIEIYYGNRLSFTINRYRQYVRELLERAVVDSILLVPTMWTGNQWRDIYQYQNVGEITQTGWESTGTLNVGPVMLKGTYSWNDSRIKRSISSSSSRVPGSTFPGVPTHTENVQIHMAHGPTSVTMVTNYTGSIVRDNQGTAIQQESAFAGSLVYVSRKLTFFGQRSKPGYVKSDLIVSRRLKSWMTAELNITNLGNSYAADVSDSWPSLGRQTLLGISIQSH